MNPMILSKRYLLIFLLISSILLPTQDYGYTFSSTVSSTPRLAKSEAMLAGRVELKAAVLKSWFKDSPHDLTGTFESKFEIINQSTFPNHKRLHIKYALDQVDFGYAYVLIPSDLVQSEKKVPLVIVTHPADIGGKDVVVGNYENPAQNDDERKHRLANQYALSFVKNGYVVFVPDRAGFGERQLTTGNYTEQMTFFENKLKERLPGWNLEGKAVYDLKVGIDYLFSQFDFIIQNSVGIIGHSIGAWDAIMHMAFDERITASVVSSDGMVRFKPEWWESDDVLRTALNEIEAYDSHDKVNLYYMLAAPRSVLYMYSMDENETVNPQLIDGYPKTYQYFKTQSNDGKADFNYYLHTKGTYFSPESSTLSTKWLQDRLKTQILPPVVYHVKPTGDDSHSGTSWDEAYATIQTAVKNAAYGDIIKVASGHFKESTTINIPGSIKLTLKGGYDIETNMQNFENKTIIDGDSKHQIINVISESWLVLDNFILQNGNGKRGTAAVTGGALYTEGTFDITNCVFKNNSTVEAKDGGAIHINNLTAEEPLRIVNCEFYDNVSDRNAGAIRISRMPVSIINSTFTRNTAKQYAGAILVHDDGTNRNGELFLYNSILWNNFDTTPQDREIQLSGGKKATFDHNIIKGGADGIYTNSGIKNFINNAETDAMNVDPLFVSNENFQLTEQSPAIDAGDNELFGEQEDIDILGKARISGQNIDLGAHEYTDATGTNTISMHNMSIYPNPAANFITIKTTDILNTQFTIYDVYGRVVISGAYSGNMQVIDVSSLADGIYFLRMKDEIIKMIIQK